MEFDFEILPRRGVVDQIVDAINRQPDVVAAYNSATTNVND